MDRFDDFEALALEVQSDSVAGAALCENDFRRRVGDAFEQARRKHNLSIRDLAAKMGTSVSQVQRLLHEEQGGSVTLRTVFRAAHVLQLDVMPHIQEKRQPLACGQLFPFAKRWIADRELVVAEPQESAALPSGGAARPWTKWINFSPADITEGCQVVNP